MKVRKAIITSAAPAQNTLPLQKIVDRDGREKTALQLIVEEVVSAGVEEICVVIQPGDQLEFQRAAGDEAGILTFVEQPQPLGYADAICRGKDFVNGESFLHLVGDHLYLSENKQNCASQLIEVAKQHECSVSAVQPTREKNLQYFGAIGGNIVDQKRNLYEVTAVLEKPSPTQAEQSLIIAGQRAGFYQCFFGMHVLSGSAMDRLHELVSDDSQHRATLSDALRGLSEKEKYLAFEVAGTRYNIGEKYGLFTAQAALAMAGSDRDQILTMLLELLATRKPANPS